MNRRGNQNFNKQNLENILNFNIESKLLFKFVLINFKIVIKYTYYKIHHLNYFLVYRSVVFSTLTWLGSQSPEFFPSCKTETLGPLKIGRKNPIFPPQSQFLNSKIQIGVLIFPPYPYKVRDYRVSDSCWNSLHSRALWPPGVR